MRPLRVVAALLLLIPLVAGVACKKKEPETPPDLMTTSTDVTPPPVEVTQEEAPSAMDETERILSGDLAGVNEYVQDSGLIGDVFFDFDKYDLRSEARDRLAKNAQFLTTGRGADFVATIEGHCDERGTNEYNLALGDRRANAAREYLVSLGVPAHRVRTISYGEERPFCHMSGESCWSKNRRAHFLITGRVD
jgi:peptidoglycan-associated lipoprotein